MRRCLRLVAAALLCASIVGCGGPQPSPSAAATLRRDPKALSYTLRDPRPPVRLPGTTHAIDLRIEERFITVAEGIVAELWSLAGTVPGPVIRVQAGDSVRVHLMNWLPRIPPGHPPVNDYPHGLEFDGVTGAGGNQTVTLKPAEETVFEFEADTPGVWLYHGSGQSLLQNITYGMYGMLIVEPKGGLSPVDQELFLVQGEWYVGDYQGLPPPPSLAKAQAANPAPDFVVLNGVADQYREHPISVGARTRIRAFLLDAGPNLPASFGIEGVTFDRVVKNGGEATAGDENGGGARTVDLSPGQGAIVEFSLPRDGLYPILLPSLGSAGTSPQGLLETVAATPAAAS